LLKLAEMENMLGLKKHDTYHVIQNITVYYTAPMPSFKHKI